MHRANDREKCQGSKIEGAGDTKNVKLGTHHFLELERVTAEQLMIKVLPRLISTN